MNLYNKYSTFLSVLLIIVMSGCTGLPENINPVVEFDVERYLGKWYEIARLNHSFENGLTKVTAEYSKNPGGSIKVINEGFSTGENLWKQAEGKAIFVEDPTLGFLKVSFFGPFYGSYVIFELDDHYQYAFITSYNRSYLWLLSRTPEISDSLKTHFLETITRLGFDEKGLIFVTQDKGDL